MDPAYLGMLTSIGVNKKVYQPSAKEIKDKYYELFRGTGASAGASEAGPEHARAVQRAWLVQRVMVASTARPRAQHPRPIVLPGS